MISTRGSPSVSVRVLRCDLSGSNVNVCRPSLAVSSNDIEKEHEMNNQEAHAIAQPARRLYKAKARLVVAERNGALQEARDLRREMAGAEAELLAAIAEVEEQ